MKGAGGNRNTTLRAKFFNAVFNIIKNRDGRIRTNDLLLPKQPGGSITERH